MKSDKLVTFLIALVSIFFGGFVNNVFNNSRVNQLETKDAVMSNQLKEIKEDVNDIKLSIRELNDKIK